MNSTANRNQHLTELNPLSSTKKQGEKGEKGGKLQNMSDIYWPFFSFLLPASPRRLIKNDFISFADCSLHGFFTLSLCSTLLKQTKRFEELLKFTAFKFELKLLILSVIV